MRTGNESGHRRARRVLSLIWCALLAVSTPSFATRWESESRAWAMQIDDDFLALARHDRDYTAGVSFTLVDDDPVARRLPLASALDWIDRVTRFARPRPGAANEQRALEFGFKLFTPSELQAEQPLPNDRPYASQAYVTGSKLTVDPSGGVALQSSLTLGVLGLPILGAVHRGLHELIGSPLPNGYAHQVSAGGEPTFRYAVSRQRLLASGMRRGRPYSVRYGFGASVGDVTEVTAELAFRSGPLRSAWWSAPPMSSGYAGQPAIVTPPRSGRARDRGVIFEAGIESRLRLYDAFLQGQFRGSDVTFSSDALEHLLVEEWLGVAFQLEGGLELGYTIRRQSREIVRGTGARAFTWGSLSFVQRF